MKSMYIIIVAVFFWHSQASKAAVSSDGRDLALEQIGKISKALSDNALEEIIILPSFQTIVDSKGNKSKHLQTSKVAYLKENDIRTFWRLLLQYTRFHQYVAIPQYRVLIISSEDKLILNNVFSILYVGETVYLRVDFGFNNKLGKEVAEHYIDIELPPAFSQYLDANLLPKK